MTQGGKRATAIPLVLGGDRLGAGRAPPSATELFDELGPVGTVFLRLVFAAAVLVAIWRPALSGLRGAHARDVWLFGISLAAMNTQLLSVARPDPARDRGDARVRRPARRRLRRHPAAGATCSGPALAAAGILLLSPGLGDGLDALGVALALLAGGFWAAYIVLAQRIGGVFEGGSGLALAMVIAAAC